MEGWMPSRRTYLPKDKGTRVNTVFDISDWNVIFVSLILRSICSAPLPDPNSQPKPSCIPPPPIPNLRLFSCPHYFGQSLLAQGLCGWIDQYSCTTISEKGLWANYLAKCVWNKWVSYIAHKLVRLFTPKEYIVLINQDGNFCEQLTNMFSCAFVYVSLCPRYWQLVLWAVWAY